jgi:hypothetical protein
LIYSIVRQQRFPEKKDLQGMGGGPRSGVEA